MIVFEGENSLECKKKAADRNSKMLFYAYLILFLVAFPVCFILFLLDIETASTLSLSILSFLFLPISFMILLLPSKMIDRMVWKRRIEFTSDKVIFINHVNSLNVTKNDWDISLIKKIKDVGIYYEVRIKNQKLICEKSLICEGTIEQFENRFKAKIARAVKNNSIDSNT